MVKKPKKRRFPPPDSARGEDAPVSDDGTPEPRQDVVKVRLVKDRSAGLFGGKRLRNDPKGLIAFELAGQPVSGLLQGILADARRVTDKSKLAWMDAQEIKTEVSFLSRCRPLLRLDDADADLVDALLEAAVRLGMLLKRMHLRKYEPDAERGQKSQRGAKRGGKERGALAAKEAANMADSYCKDVADEMRKKQISKSKAVPIVASKFRCSQRTVWRALRAEPLRLKTTDNTPPNVTSM